MPTNGMTIDGLNTVSSLTAQDEVPVWDKEASGEPTRKITAQNMANSVKSLASLPNTTEMNDAIAQSTANTRTNFTGLVIYDYAYYVWVPMDSAQLNKNITLESITSIVIPNIIDITQYKSAISKRANGVYISFSSGMPDISTYTGKAVSITITI